MHLDLERLQGANRGHSGRYGKEFATRQTTQNQDVPATMGTGLFRGSAGHQSGARRGRRWGTGGPLGAQCGCENSV